MTFLEAMKEATILLFHGHLKEAEAVMHGYFHPGGVTTQDTGNNGPGPH